MRRALALIVATVVLLLGGARAEATAYGSGPDVVSAWPALELEPSSLIVVSALTKAPAEALASAPLVLEAEGRGDVVALERLSVTRPPDGGHAVQALLRPTRRLEPGVRYRLTLADHALSWLVSANPAVAAPLPVWWSKAYVVERSYARGPRAESMLVLGVPLRGDPPGELQVLVRATSLATGDVFTLVTPVVDGRTEVGHRARVPGVPFEPDVDLALELTLLDRAGRMVPMPDGPLVTRSPGPGDRPRRLRDSDGPGAFERSLDWVLVRVAWPYGLGLIGVGVVMGVVVRARRREA